MAAAYLGEARQHLWAGHAGSSWQPRRKVVPAYAHRARSGVEGPGEALRERGGYRAIGARHRLLQGGAPAVCGAEWEGL